MAVIPGMFRARSECVMLYTIADGDVDGVVVQ